MKRIIIGIVFILFSGYAYAEVLHPEDPTIRGRIGSIGDDVCFDNSPANFCAEGYVYAFGSNWTSTPTGINGCGITAVDPVSGAACPLVSNAFASCTPNQYVLVQTKVSGHYFAVKAGATCGLFSRPENEVIFPCRSTDAFDQVSGCYDPTPPEISVKGGFIRAESSTFPPLDVHCNDVVEFGRMAVDGVNDIIYVCTPTGWSAH